MPQMILDWHLNSRYDQCAIIAALGIIPEFILADDPRPAHEQINERYGWNPHLPGKWQMNQDDWLLYPGDPPLEPLAFTWLRDEKIIVYSYGWVAIVTGEAFSVARLV